MSGFTTKGLGTGLEYIRGRDRVIFSNGVVCSVAEFDQYYKNGLAQKINEWKLDPAYSGYDFAYAKSVGVIRKKAFHPTGPVRPPEAEEESPAVKPAEVKVEVPEVTEPQSKYFFTANIIITVMAVVGILSMIMSAYHTATAMHIQGRNYFTGWVTGIVMILFSATAFTASRFFFSEKGFAKVFAVVFAMLGVVIVCYSMFSTLIVNYTNYKVVASAETEENIHNSAELNSYNKQIQMYETRLEQIDAEIKTLEESAEYWKTMSWNRYDGIQASISDLRKERSEVSSKLLELESNLPDTVAKAEKESENVYSFFSGITGITVNILQLFVQSVPAMFFDIIAPFALTCSLYLKDRKKEEENA